jgi:hypothetical protein
MILINLIGSTIRLMGSLFGENPIPGENKYESARNERGNFMKLKISNKPLQVVDETFNFRIYFP